MIEVISVLVVFLVLVALLFGGAVRVGILVGQRLDRTLEARASARDAATVASEENRGE
jgi:hypothetical protein